MHIYAFGSVCRGQIDHGSDVDLLALVEEFDKRFDPETYSIYSYRRIKEIWRGGNPFAWHLANEAIILFADDGKDFLKTLGRPSSYENTRVDCKKFHNIFSKAWRELKPGSPIAAFLLSTMFLGYRNFATCYSLSESSQPTFSRNSALELQENSLDIEPDVHKIFANARLLCTRGVGVPPDVAMQKRAFSSASKIHEWMRRLRNRIGDNV